jgi:prevent-host-death family protein
MTEVLMVTTLSSREFNQDTGRAIKATETGLVVITDRGKPVYVLMTFSDYQRVMGKRKNILDLVGMKGAGDIDIVTRNVSDFSQSGVKIFDPWD